MSQSPGSVVVPAVDPKGTEWIQGRIATAVYLSEAEAAAKKVSRADVAKRKRRVARLAVRGKRS